MKKVFAIIMSLVLMLGCCVSVAAEIEIGEKIGLQFNGEMVELENKLQFERTGELEGTLYLPLREVTELMGGKVFWNGTSRTSAIVFGEDDFYEVISFTDGSNIGTYYYLEDGEKGEVTEFEMEGAVYVDAATGRTYVPHNFYNDYTIFMVNFDVENLTVIIVDVWELLFGFDDSDMTFEVTDALYEFLDRHQDGTYHMLMEVEGTKDGLERTGSLDGVFDVNDNSEYAYNFNFTDLTYEGVIKSDMENGLIHISQSYDKAGNKLETPTWFTVDLNGELSELENILLDMFRPLDVVDMNDLVAAGMEKNIGEVDFDNINDWNTVKSSLGDYLYMISDAAYVETEDGTLKLEKVNEVGVGLFDKVTAELTMEDGKVVKLVAEMKYTRVNEDGETVVIEENLTELPMSRTHIHKEYVDGEMTQDLIREMTYEVSEVEPNVELPEDAVMDELMSIPGK